MLAILRKSAAIAVFVFVVACALPSFAQGGAVDFSMRAVDGDAVTSQSLRGEVVVLAFGASWLPLTRNQMEALKKLADQYAGRGLVVYWVSTESESAKSKNYVADDQRSLVFHEWRNASCTRGGNHGDIASAAAPLPLGSTEVMVCP